MGLEYEKKYRASRKTLDLVDNALIEPSYPLEMETTYYDTPDGALSARRITLRRRFENGVSVCTLKTPTGTAARGEFQVEKAEITEAISELCKLSGFDELLTLTAKGVVPVCGAKFARTAREISFGNSTLEVAIDRGVLIGGSKELPLYELEVELLSGEPGDADLYGKLLAAKFSLSEEKLSKFRRALALAKGEI